eukprot:31526-Pelagococcus_subviridis.AAC.6
MSPHMEKSSGRHPPTATPVSARHAKSSQYVLVEERDRRVVHRSDLDSTGGGRDQTYAVETEFGRATGEK